MLSLLLAVDATIVSESSSIDLIGSVGLAFEGALIGNYDEEANPQGTLTRPGSVSYTHLTLPTMS